MRTQAEFVAGIKVAVEHIFARRVALRRVAVRFQFWPEGLVVACNITARNNDELQAGRQEVIGWAELADFDPAKFDEIINRVCQPAHDRLSTGGPGR